MTRPQSQARGVTLVEMAIVLLILGILTKAAIVPLTAVQAHQQHHEASLQLERIRSAMWAHVASAGVLPCPVDVRWSVADGSTAACQQLLGGVPARLLNLSGAIDTSGALIDPWGRPYHLAVSQVSHEEQGLPDEPDWTSPGEASRVGIAELDADIVICQQSVSGRCPDIDIRASELSFVVFSAGADGSTAGDQQENLDGDNVFVVQEPSVNTESPFDDLLLWGSAAETVYWMLRAGWLP